MTVRSDSPVTFVLPIASTVTVLPWESTTLPPFATVRLETVESLVATHADVGSTLTLRGLVLVDAVSFWVMAAAESKSTVALNSTTSALVFVIWIFVPRRRPLFSAA